MHTFQLFFFLLASGTNQVEIRNTFDDFSKGATVEGYRTGTIGSGPLGLWLVGKVKKPASWPYVLMQDGRPYPPRCVTLEPPLGLLERVYSTVTVGWSDSAQGGAGFILLSADGEPQMAFVLRPAGRGLKVLQWQGREERWIQDVDHVVAGGGPLLLQLFVTREEDPEVHITWGSVDKLEVAWRGPAPPAPWRVALIAWSEGRWWFDNLRIKGRKVERQGKIEDEK